MIRSPLGLRIGLDPSRSPRDQIREAAVLGAKGVVLDAAGDLSPDRLSETGRRDLRHTLRSVELSLIALNLPTRRPWDTDQDLDSRLTRADRAFALTYELGTRLVLLNPGAIPAEDDALRRTSFVHALTELGRRADHRGVRLAIETAPDPGVATAAILDMIASPGLAASLDPSPLLVSGHDPGSVAVALSQWLVHAYAPDQERNATIAGGFGRRGVTAGRSFAWEDYLGALEEIGYRGFLTIWPDAKGDVAGTFRSTKALLDRF